MPRCTDSQIAQSCRFTMSQKSPASEGSKPGDATSTAANSSRHSIAVRSTASGRSTNAATWSAEHDSIRLG